ncbi:MAG: hypothetical protein V3574_01005 [Candidatus Moraniibacteriota bacterium]
MINKKISTIAGTIILLTIAMAVSIFFLLGFVKTEDTKNETIITEPSINIDTKNKLPENTAKINQDSDKDKSFNMSDPFQPTPSEKGEYYGTLTLTGYLNIEHRICEKNEPCKKTVDYASLVVVSSNNDLIYEYMQLHKGNSFVNENSIGIGCYEKNKNQIYSINNSNYGSFDNIIKGKDLQKILQSSVSQPVTMQLSKSYLTVGSGAPECYSHFREFKILDK